MDITNRNKVKSFVTKDSSIIREILAPNNSCTKRQSLAEATLNPGAETQAHSHPNTEELYYVLTGEGLMAIEGEHSRVGAGDAIVIPPGARHQIRNIGEIDLIFLCCCVPAYMDSDTIMCESLLLDSIVK